MDCALNSLPKKHPFLTYEREAQKHIFVLSGKEMSSMMNWPPNFLTLEGTVCCCEEEEKKNRDPSLHINQNPRIAKEMCDQAIRRQAPGIGNRSESHTLPNSSLREADSSQSFGFDRIANDWDSLGSWPGLGARPISILRHWLEKKDDQALCEKNIWNL